MRFLLAMLLLCLFGWWYAHEPVIVHGPGILAPEAPEQSREYFGKSWDYKTYKIKPLATYRIKARVLGIESYHFDREAELAPYDFALGWQEMSNSEVLSQFSITQAGRWYYISWPSTPTISESDIFLKSANTHLIPANASVKSDIGRIKRGDVLVMEGYLVRAEASDGWDWESSLSRADRGDGSCELFWVEKVLIER